MFTVRTTNNKDDVVHFSRLTLAKKKKPKSPRGDEDESTKRRTIKTTKCIAASRSHEHNIYSNLNYGSKKWWCTPWGDKSGWLLFDLGCEYVLKQIQMAAQKKRCAPQKCSVDYLNHAGDLMFEDVVKFSYNDTGKLQDFEIKNEIPVRHVKVKILSNWGDDFIGINKISFNGVKADVYDNQEDDRKEEAPARRRPKHVALKWEIGDRIDYQWDESGKWHTGRILHINEDYTYLIKDDYNFVKDHIPPEKVKQTT
eukprot:UN31756